MQKKELVLVVAGAVVIGNLSIVATLMASGHFDDPASEVVETEVAEEENVEVEAVEEEDVVDEGTPAEPKPTAADYLRDISQAMYICEDKFLDSTLKINKSYEFKHSESHFSAEEDLYRVFIEYHTVGLPGSPSASWSVVCEVSAPKRTILGYKVLPL